jgi:hypothetical protein
LPLAGPEKDRQRVATQKHVADQPEREKTNARRNYNCPHITPRDRHAIIVFVIHEKPYPNR